MCEGVGLHTARCRQELKLLGECVFTVFSAVVCVSMPEKYKQFPAKKTCTKREGQQCTGRGGAGPSTCSCVG